MRPFKPFGSALSLLLAICVGVLGFMHQALSNATLGLVPHRAIYDLTLDEVDTATGITAGEARLIVEVKGSPCEGWTTQSQLLMTLMADNDASVVNDMRYASYESGDGSMFTYNLENFINSETTEQLRGTAERLSEAVALSVTGGLVEERELSQDILFPTAFNAALIDAARQGKALFFADLFDGSLASGKAQPTSVTMGKRISDVTYGEEGEESVRSDAWPVSIVYFDPDVPDGAPALTIAMTLMENGVALDPVFDHGDFVFNGSLVDLVVFDKVACTN